LLLGEEIGLGACPEATGDLEAVAAGGGAGFVDPSAPVYVLGGVYSGRLQPGDESILPLMSDTSGSIIIILRVQQSPGVPFSLETPGGLEVDPFTAGALGVEYLSYADGEGQGVQSYTFRPGEVGTFLALVTNPPENEALDYTLEIHLESSLRLMAALDRAEVDPGEDPPILTATLADGELPIAGAEVSARLERPDGTTEFMTLEDNGQGADAVALDGVYSGELSPGGQPGTHQIQVVANDGAEPTFERTTFLQLLVRSDAAHFGDRWESGVEDRDADGHQDRLWIEGDVVGLRAGTYLVLGKLTALDGSPVAEVGVFFYLDEPQTASFRLYFDGEDIYSSQRDGPYILKEVELIDGQIGFVRADFETDVHETEHYFSGEFGIGGGVPFRRGDTNSDGDVDISDAIHALLFLFNAGLPLLCDDAADANGDGEIDISDAIFLLNFLFLGGPDLPAPYPDCGLAPDLGCEEYPHC
jgi:hypothetical protein